jgi:hypothetical protein
MLELLEGLVPGLPVDLRTQIMARAQGVPLYAVETVRMLLDRGLLVREGAVYHPTGEIETLEVPETLHALIAARLDGVSREERRLLQDGAVLGKTFTSRALEALGGRSRDELEPLLASLVRKEVLGVQSDPRSPERGQYGFLQDLVRHVAYETLSKRERKARHLAAADHLREAFPDEDGCSRGWRRTTAAYESAPEADDATGSGVVAVDASLVRERAASLGATDEARRCYAKPRRSPTHRARGRARCSKRAASVRTNRPATHAAAAARGHFTAAGDRRAPRAPRSRWRTCRVAPPEA